MVLVFCFEMGKNGSKMLSLYIPSLCLWPSDAQIRTPPV